jgi:hypothetical protein
MRTFSNRALVWTLSVFAAFAAGVASEHFGREAHADSMTGVSTLYVPPGGLVFKATDGTPLARIGRDAHGGTLELYDEHGEIAGRRQHGPRVTPALLRENPYVDMRDPWTTEPVPGPGY